MKTNSTWVEQVRQAAMEILNSATAANEECLANGWDLGSFILRGLSNPEEVVGYLAIKRACDAQSHLRQLTRELMTDHHIDFYTIHAVYSPILSGEGTA